MSRVGQGTGTEHVAQAPISPGASCCQGRQTGGSELLGTVVVLEPPSGPSYFKADRRSLVQPALCSTAA